jgi:DNA repair exonuclease SbcCD ATPase subunit
MAAYFEQQTVDQEIIQGWEARERAGIELAKIDSEATTLAKQLAAAQSERDRHKADIQALDEASQGQEASIAAARTALGHWQSYKSVAKAKEKLQATRESIAAARAKDPQPETPGPLSATEIARDMAARSERTKELNDFIRMFDEHGVAECPTCHTPSSQLVDQVAQHKKELIELNAAIDELAEARTKQHAIERTWQDWSNRERDREAAEQRANAAEQELTAVAPPALSEDELSQTVADYDSFQKARQALAPLLQAASSKCDRLEGQLSALRDRRAELSEQLATAQVTQADVHQARTRLTKLGELLAERDQLAQTRSEALWRQRDAQRALDQALADEQKAAQLRTWVARAERTREALKHAPRLVAQRNLQRLEASINELLRIFQVNFQVKVAEDGTPTFIAEFYDGRRQVAQRLSIGQKTVLALAFRVAVNAQFAEEIGLLALDEPTASLDQPRIQALAPVLEKLRELSTAKGLQCLMVTHAATLSNLFESAIELEPPELRHALTNG